MSASSQPKSALRFATQTSELVAAFQPIVELSTFEVIGYEALGRVRRGAIETSVGPLLHRAHGEGWLLSLDRALRRTALEAIARSPRRRELQWFLNVDSRCVDDPAFSPGFTRRTIEDLGLDGIRVVIELAEHDPKLDSERLSRLYPSYARQGFAIALDDFGRGHASLTVALAVRPDLIKLDGGIVKGIGGDRARQAMVRALSAFASDTGTSLVAEGIESACDLDALREAGIRFGQGFLIGAPGPLPSSLGPTSTDQAA